MTVGSVEIRGVVHRYGGFQAVDDVTLSIPAGQYSVLLGPSGSGKTTLLSIIGGFVLPEHGSVLIGGEDVTRLPPARRPTATVFQDYALFPHMSVAANIGFGLRMRGVSRRARDARARDMLRLVGLEEAFSRKPHQLSGGQRQRVALARALAVEPAVLLLDEPLGALDLKLRRLMQEELKRIQSAVGATFVHVTHDQEEAMAIADRIIVMRGGRIEDEGPPERIYLRPRTRFAAEFMGESSTLRGEVRAAAADRLVLATAVGDLDLPASGHAFSVSQLALVSIRPEHLRTEPSADAVFLGGASIEAVAFLGANRQARLASASDPGFRPRIFLPAGSPAQIGDHLQLWLPRDLAVVLPAAD